MEERDCLRPSLHARRGDDRHTRRLDHMVCSHQALSIRQHLPFGELTRKTQRLTPSFPSTTITKSTRSHNLSKGDEPLGRAPHPIGAQLVRVESHRNVLRRPRVWRLSSAIYEQLDYSPSTSPYVSADERADFYPPSPRNR